MKKSNPTVLPTLIIGAGMAGISCAKKLHDAGEKVILLEARKRIGGRIHSIQHHSDTFDLGASWIHGIKNNPLWDITQHNNIETTVFNYDISQFFHQNGQPFSEEQTLEFEDHIQKINDLLPQQHTASALIALQNILKNFDYVGNLFPKDHLKDLIFSYFERIANDPFATDLSQLSAHYAQYEGYFDGDEVIFPHGYSQIIEILQHSLEIKTNIEIKTIILKDDHIQLIDQHQNIYLGSRVVISVPLGILKHNHLQFSPQLPPAYTHAIQNLGFGTFNKAFFELEQPLSFRENHKKNSISDFYWYEGRCYNILDLSDVYHKPMYLIIFGGAQAEQVDLMSDTAVWELIFRSLDANFKDIPKQPKMLQITRWGIDPYSFGSFSFPHVNHHENLIHTLNESIENKLFFIGEHCSLKYAGTVHGAYLSGYEAALKILK